VLWEFTRKITNLLRAVRPDTKTKKVRILKEGQKGILILFAKSYPCYSPIPLTIHWGPAINNDGTNIGTSDKRKDSEVEET